MATPSLDSSRPPQGVEGYWGLQAAGHQADDDRAAGRNPDGVGDWQIFDGLNPYSGTNPPLGNGCSPTPALANACGPRVPAAEKTWGAIKGLYEN